VGNDQRGRAELRKRLGVRARPKSPFEALPRIYRSAKWVRPELVAEVEFTGFTADGMLLDPSFKGVRTDKRAHDVRLEPIPGALWRHRPRFGKRPSR
jgi:bifunctional non-homologous end joining protein LigD